MKIKKNSYCYEEKVYIYTNIWTHGKDLMELVFLQKNIVRVN